jgi:hypothetical protein
MGRMRLAQRLMQRTGRLGGWVVNSAVCRAP